MRGVVLCVFDSASEANIDITRRCTDALLQFGLAVLTLQRPASHSDGSVDRGSRALFLGLNEALQWLISHEKTAALPIGVWACGDCVVPALMLAAQHGELVDAAICCGGHPESTPAPVLQTLRAPTLLLVDLDDTCMLEAEERTTAMRPRALRMERLALKPGDENVTTPARRIANLSAHWMFRYLVYPPAWSILGKG